MREIPKDAEEWVFGRCYLIALALHRATGWQIGGLTAVRNARRGRQMPHAFVIDPEGEKWDAAGRLTEEDLFQDFFSREPDHVRESAQHECWSDEISWFARHEGLAGDFAEEMHDWFRRGMPEAETYVGEVLAERFPEIGAAMTRTASPDLAL